MGLAMPKPVLIGKTFYLRIHIPLDVTERVQGGKISIPVGGAFKVVALKKTVKVSLRTSDPLEAKKRFTEAYTALLQHWDAVRAGPCISISQGLTGPRRGGSRWVGFRF